MGERIGVQLLVREIYLGLTNHPGQLSLAIPLWVGAMSTGQRAVMLCDWGVKADIFPRTHRPFNVLFCSTVDLFAWCVRLSRLIVGFRTHFKSLHFHFISFHLVLFAGNTV